MRGIRGTHADLMRKIYFLAILVMFIKKPLCIFIKLLPPENRIGYMFLSHLLCVSGHNRLGKSIKHY